MPSETKRRKAAREVTPRSAGTRDEICVLPSQIKDFKHFWFLVEASYVVLVEQETDEHKELYENLAEGRSDRITALAFEKVQLKAEAATLRQQLAEAERELAAERGRRFAARREAILWQLRAEAAEQRASESCVCDSCVTSRALAAGRTEGTT